MSISNYLEKKDKKVIVIVEDLKKLRKPIKIINRKKPCDYCGKYRFTVVYKRRSDKVLAYKCEYCGYSVFVGKKVENVINKEKIEPSIKSIDFKCPLGGLEYCVRSTCTYYGNICNLT